MSGFKSNEQRRAGEWSRLGVLVIALLLLALTGLTSACSEDPQTPTSLSCTASRDCPGGQFCGCGGVCVTPNPCESDRDCCANEVCTDELCLDRFSCEADSECASGRECRGCVCVPHACTSDEECGATESCDGGVCLDATQLPCRGLCGLGTVCSPILDECVATPVACTHMTCGLGEALIISGVDEHLGPTCNLEPECACTDARDVPRGDIGTEFSALSLGGARFAVLAHDHRYGDLVYFEVDDGQVYDAFYIDGIPDEAPTGIATGRRGGVIQPGPRRGAMPSAARTDFIAVAYRDDDATALRFAQQSADGSWQASVVDDDGDVGLDPNLVALADGRWAIAYFARTDDRSALRLAVSNNVNPTASGDWRIIEIDSAARSEVDSADVPVGVGLYPSMILSDSQLVIAYYASDEGRLRIARGTPGGAFEIYHIDPDATRSGIEDSADAGFCPSLAQSPSGLLAVAFMDRISGQVLYLELDANGSITAAGEAAELEPGRRMSPPRLIGTDLRLVFSSSGQPMAVYQDASEGDLVAAFRSGGRNGEWQRTPVVRQGLAGFSPYIFPNVGIEPWVLHGIISDVGGGELAESLDARTFPLF